MKDGKLEEALAVAAMAVLVAITLLNVMTRYFTDESYAWTEELSVFLVVLMALASASAIALHDRHIRIEFLFNRRNAQGEEVPRRKLKLFSCLVTSAVFSLMAALFVRWVWDQYKFAETSMGLGVPLWWYGLALPVLCPAISARAFGAFLEVLRQPLTGELPEGTTSKGPRR